MGIELIYIAVTALIAAGIGFYWGRNTRPDLKARASLEAQVADAEARHQELKSQLDEHFSETARLVNQLSAQYRGLHEHLSKGQQALAADIDPDDKILALVDQGPSDHEETATSQPLDYSAEPGTLAEASKRGG